MSFLNHIPLQASRDWQIDFGPVSGAAGSVTTLSNAPQCIFQGQKVMATDSSTPPGIGTRIMSILVGNRLQRPTANGSTTALFFAPYALGNGIRWDVCEKALTIAVTISFVSACTFEMSVFGRAVLMLLCFVFVGKVL